MAMHNSCSCHACDSRHKDCSLLPAASLQLVHTMPAHTPVRHHCTPHFSQLQHSRLHLLLLLLVLLLLHRALVQPPAPFFLDGGHDQGLPPRIGVLCMVAILQTDVAVDCALLSRPGVLVRGLQLLPVCSAHTPRPSSSQSHCCEYTTSHVTRWLAALCTACEGT